MCELFYIKNKKDKPIPKFRIRDFLNTAELGAYSNSDGTGAFNRSGIVFKTDKSMDELDKDSLVEQLHGSREIVLHLRMATTGSVSKKNAHPFENDGQLLAHNGVMRGNRSYGDNDMTDSERFLLNITDKEADSPVKRTKKALETTSGSLSIFYRDKETGATHYFRNGSSFYFGETELELVGATKKGRLTFLSRIRRGYDVKNVDQPPKDKIYNLEYNFLLEVEDFELGENRSYDGMYGGSTYVRTSKPYNSGGRKKSYSINKSENKSSRPDYSSMEGMTYEEYKREYKEEDMEEYAELKDVFWHV